MSNIRTLNDLRNQNNSGGGSSQNNPPRGFQRFEDERSNPQSSQQRKSLTQIGSLLINFLFPGFSLSSVTFTFTALLTLIYILQLIFYYTGIFGRNTGWPCLLYKLGAKYTYAISKEYQLWRLITPVFLHSNFMHLFWNVLSFWMVGFQVETSIIQSKMKYTLLLAIGGISGNLLSSVLSTEDFGVGASSSLFAVLAYLAFTFITNFNSQQMNSMNGPQLAQTFLFMLTMGLTLMNGLMVSGSNVDAYGHLGGFVAGIMVAMVFKQYNQYKVLKIPAAMMLVGYMVGLGVILFLRRIPHCEGHGYCDVICE
ncbi:hypothetical protein FGO68_gene3186 [Halteria grandinella]|uniref:Rhomboid-like protease n=1 Tax=Halteria grandinella TaxID=5974 RepID=A0A8J8NLS5_HALGN|nr:hypothetical protein FGO68_gene3186 [Halteria grandinella]